MWVRCQLGIEGVRISVARAHVTYLFRMLIVVFPSCWTNYAPHSSVTDRLLFKFTISSKSFAFRPLEEARKIPLPRGYKSLEITLSCHLVALRFWFQPCVTSYITWMFTRTNQGRPGGCVRPGHVVGTICRSGNIVYSIRTPQQICCTTCREID